MDYTDIEPLFGTLDDTRGLVDDAHTLGLEVIVDFVANHTSDEHPWFRAALAAGPGSDARARYHLRDSRGEADEQPPNDWISAFGGPAWTRVTGPDGTPGQWYLHPLSRGVGHPAGALADAAPTPTWLGGPDGVLAFSRGNFARTVNLSSEPVPVIGPPRLASAPLVNSLLPPDAAVWTSGLPRADQAAQHTLHEGR